MTNRKMIENEIAKITTGKTVERKCFQFQAFDGCKTAKYVVMDRDPGYVWGSGETEDEARMDAAVAQVANRETCDGLEVREVVEQQTRSEK